MFGFSDRATFKSIVIVSLLIVFSFILRSPWLGDNPIFLWMSRSVILILINFSLIIYWGISINKRIIQRQILKFLLIIVYLMLFWLTVRMIKYSLPDEVVNLSRWLWYSYYIPMLLIPLFSVFVSLSLDKAENYKLSTKSLMLIIPVIILIILVLFNDVHQQVFSFHDKGIMSDKNYDYGILYWVVWFFMVFPLLLSILITITKIPRPSRQNKTYLVFLPYLAGVLYGVLYILRIPLLRVLLGDMTTIFCLLTMALFESHIQTGLIRSNIFYEELFYESDLKAKILNYDNEVCYSTNQLLLDEKNTYRQSSFSINGGKVVWMEDISEIDRLIQELEDVNAQLSQENTLLQAELELKERRVRVTEKLRLYNKINILLEDKLDLIDSIVQQQSELSKEKLLLLVLIGTYVKRQSNLILLKEERSFIEIDELGFSCLESMEILNYEGIKTSFDSCLSGYIVDAEFIFNFYKLCQDLMESYIDTLSTFFVGCELIDNTLVFKIQLNNKEKSTINYQSLKELLKPHEVSFSLNLNQSDGSFMISTSLFYGGVNQ